MVIAGVVGRVLGTVDSTVVSGELRKEEWEKMKDNGNRHSFS